MFHIKTIIFKLISRHYNPVKTSELKTNDTYISSVVYKPSWPSQLSAHSPSFPAVFSSVS